ncbi:MAG: hypothetical protein F7C82_03515, partial [Desulfurococcales archaeon]|nr:hypothetical protein [Desulfurococcales archaeon]
NSLLLFFTGGAVGTLTIAHTRTAYQPSRQRELVRRRPSEPVLLPLGNSGLFSREGLTSSDLRSGILVTGTASTAVIRTLVKRLVELGRRVIIIGHEKMVPVGVKYRAVKVSSINVSEDISNIGSEAAESFLYAFAVANRLRNDDIPLLYQSINAAIKSSLAGRAKADEFLKLVAEGIADKRRAAVIEATTSTMKAISQNGIAVSTLLGSDEWDVILFKAEGGERDRAFITSYLLLMSLRTDCFVILDNLELLVRDVNLLPYDSREPWEQMLGALTHLRRQGLVLVSKSPILSESVYRLCQTYVTTRLGESVTRPDEHLRELIQRSRSLKAGEVALLSSRGLRIIRLTPPKPAQVTFEEETVPSYEKEVKKEKRQLTTLEKEFGDKAKEAAELLERCKKLTTITDIPESDKEILNRLMELNYVTDRTLGVGNVITTDVGETVLKEYLDAIAHGISPETTKDEQTIRTEKEQPTPDKAPVQTLLPSNETELGDALAHLARAESLYRQGKYAHSILSSYKALETALKSFSGIREGHLDDLVEKLQSLELGITVEDAKTIKTVMIEASRRLSQGGNMPAIDSRRVLDNAKKVVETLSSRAVKGGDAT